MKFFTYALLCALLYSPDHAGAEELSEEKRRDIVRMLNLSGAKDVGQQTSARMLERTVESLRRAQPNLPERALEAVRKELTGFMDEKFFSDGGLIDQQAPIYHEHFSHAEVRELIAFYESPIGRKLAQCQPAITTASLKFTESFVTQLLPQIRSRVADALKQAGVNVTPKKPNN